MQHDKDIEKILLNGAEIASADFTDIIMKRINNLSGKRFYYQPLISSRIKKIFVFSCAVLVLSVLLVSLTTGSPDLALFTRIKIPIRSFHMFYNILIFILLFWTVFIINSFAEKNRYKFY